MKHSAVFLDRDGVINNAIIKNGRPYPPYSLDELSIAADVHDALCHLKSAGFLLIGVTNQPDVARGITAKTTVEEINAALIKKLPIDEIRVCYHDDQDQCLCRKPLPGLLMEAAEKYNIDFKKSVMIGDRWRDIEAGQRFGCKTIWLRNDYQEKKPANYDFIATSLSEASKWILKVYDPKFGSCNRSEKG